MNYYFKRTEYKIYYGAYKYKQVCVISSKYLHMIYVLYIMGDNIIWLLLMPKKKKKIIQIIILYIGTYTSI